MPSRGSPIYHVRYPPEKAERLELVCAERELTPSEFIRQLLDLALGFTTPSDRPG